METNESENIITIPSKLTVQQAVCMIGAWPRFLLHDEYDRVLKQLIANGFDINGNDSALLFEAFDKNDHDIIHVLFANGAKIHNGRKLYKTEDGDQRISVFHEHVATDCEEVLLRHILSEDSESQEVIISAILQNRSRLDPLNKATTHNGCDYKKDFAALCVLAGVFPEERPEYFVMRECHEAGMTHPEYTVFSDELTDITDSRDYWKNRFTVVSAKLDSCLSDITSIKQEISNLLKPEQ